MPFFPTPDPVKITPLDLGEIQNNNLRTQAMRLQNGDELRKQNALAAYGEAINSGQDRDQAANAIRAIAPDMADRLSANALTYKTGQAALANDMDKFIQTRVPMAKDQAGWDAVLGEAARRYGITIPDSLKPYSPELQQQLLMGGLSAAQRIAQQRQDATAQALGLPAGVDPHTYAGAYHSIQSAGLAAKTDARAEAQSAREAELQPYRVDNIQSEIDARKARAAQPRVIMIPDPNGLPGTKIPGYYDAETNSVTPMQIASPQGGDMSQGQPQAAPQFRSADDVKAAYKSGKLNRDQAKALLQQQFGMQ